MEKFSQEKKAALTAAKNEAHFSAKNLLEDVLPLIKSYFIAQHAFEGNAIKITFLNGQAFKLYAEEV